MPRKKSTSKPTARKTTKTAAKVGRKSGGVNYSRRSLTAAKNWSIDVKVIGAEELTKDIRKELNRVFHAVNRRLQNIDKSGVFSPAANALKAYLDSGAGVVGSFNKFAKLSTAAKGLEELKRDYAAALEFLRKPTSSASGAREFEKEIQRRLGVSKEAFKHIKDKALDGEIGTSALQPSDPTKVLDYFTTALNEDLADITENAARENGSEKIENIINDSVTKYVNKQVYDAFDKFIK